MSNCMKGKEQQCILGELGWSGMAGSGYSTSENGTGEDGHS